MGVYQRPYKTTYGFHGFSVWPSGVLVLVVGCVYYVFIKVC